MRAPRRTATSLAGLAATLLLGTGCASVSPQPSLDRVGELVGERAPVPVSWQHLDGEDEARRRVDELLAEKLTAESAVTIALLNNRSLQADFEELGLSQAAVAEASRIENPVIFGSPRFSDDGGTNLDLGLSQSLLSLLMRPARKSLATAQLEGAQLEVADGVLTLAAKVEAQYFRVLGADQVVRMRSLVREAAQASADLASRLYEAGNLSDLERTGERMLVEDARVELAKGEVELLFEREELTRLMGLYGTDVGWRLQGGLPEIPAQEISRDGLETLAIEQRLDLAAALQRVEVDSQALGITRNWRWFLTAEIGVSAERETDGEWLVGPELTLELPIFDQRQPEIAGAEARLRRSVQRMMALAVEIRSEVRTLRDRLLMTRGLIDQYRDVILPLRERLVTLTEQEYNYMLVGAFDLLLARQNEYDAYRDYIEAVRDYWITRAELRRALGGAFPTGSPS